MSSDEPLDAAHAIGRRLVAHAVWHGGRCSWVGAAADPETASRPEYRPVGARVYDGTAGVGLFLAQLAVATGDAAARRTAAGALRHAVARAPARDGLHGGTLGIALAAATAGALLGAEEPAAGASALVDRSLEPPGGDRVPDVVTGAAGAAVALLGLARALGEPRLIEAAAALGESLLASARVGRRGWSWADPRRRHPQPLCGLSHGAGGIGWALLELFAATGEARFAQGATGAFAYERSWLDEASGTWPDLRLPAGGPADGVTGTWCYGEAGIALGRRRAAALLGDGPHCRDADIALKTTRRHLTAALPYAIDDASLCHGLGGAAGALLDAGDRAAAEALGAVLLERHAHAGDWPCGVAGTTPGLMRGLSGIGWLFLRLHDSAVESPLVLPAAG